MPDLHDHKNCLTRSRPGTRSIRIFGAFSLKFL